MSEIETSTNAGDILEKQAGDPDVVKLMTALLRGKRFILLVGAICGLLAMLVSLKMHPRYTASTLILPPQISRGGSASALLSQLTSGGESSLGSIGSALQQKTQAEMFVDILGAWPLEQEVVKRLGLVEAFHARDSLEARQMLEARTVIKDTKDGFLSITVTDTDRKRSADIANTYISALQDFMHNLSLTDASQRRIFYEGQLAKTKDDLSQAEVNFKKMQQASGMISIDSQARTLIETAAGLRSEITAKEVELQGLRAYLTEANPQVQMAETQLSALRGQLSQTETQDKGGYSGGALSSMPAAELDFVRATRELKYQEGLYDLMVKQYEVSRIDEARDAPVIQVIDPALPPEFKSGPHRSIITLAAFAIGLFFGMVIVGVRYWRSQLSPEGSAKIAELRQAAFHWKR